MKTKAKTAPEIGRDFLSEAIRLEQESAALKARAIKYRILARGLRTPKRGPVPRRSNGA